MRVRKQTRKLLPPKQSNFGLIIAYCGNMRISLLALCFLSAFSLRAQDVCEYVPSSKAEKLLLKSEDKRKYSFDERQEFLQVALEEDDNCYPCMLQLGVRAFKSAKRTGSGFGEAKQLLGKLTEACPEYHSEPYYYLGAMAYADNEYAEAIKHFDYFLHFPNDDESKYARDYEEKYGEVEDVFPFVEFYRDFNKYANTYSPMLVDGVSSEKDEYLPALSPDNEIMFYTRHYMKKAKGDLVSKDVEEFTWSLRGDLNAAFDMGDALPKPFNMGDNYGGASISVDNKELFIAKRNPVASNPENIDIYLTRYELITDPNTGKKAYTWSELENLGENINTEDGWESQPSLSGDGQTLYFATLRASTQKEGANNPDTDIYYSKRQEDGTWGPAQTLGEPINTKWNDKAPFMHSDSHTLYFASDRQPGGGGYDIWYTRQQEDGTWSRPKNIGAPVNTSEDEHGMIVSSDGEYAYYASRTIRGSRGMDIYSFPIPDEAKPEKVMILKGQVMTKDGEVPKDAEINIKYVQSKEVQKIELNQDDGKYATVINMERQEDVVLQVTGEDVAFNTHLIVDKDEEKQPEVIKLDMVKEEAKKGGSFVIPDIFYTTASADINRESMIILDEFVEYLLANPSIVLEIQGHTDDEGNAADNLALSMDRAFEVKGYLEKKGINGSRIKAKGYGETRPIADNTSPSGKAKNRRTEFMIISM